MDISAAHYRQLDALRGLAAQPVLLSHACAFIFPAGLGAAAGLVAWSARLSVLVFFVLSGFVIGASILRETKVGGGFDWIGFGVRRIARIYPPYLVAIALVAVLAAVHARGFTIVGTGGDVSGFNAGLWSWPGAVLFLYTGSDGMSMLDGPVWSLRLEVGLYVFAALLALIWMARGARRLSLMATAALLLALYCSRLAYADIAIASFGCGAVAAALFRYLGGLPLGWTCVGAAAAVALPAISPDLATDSAFSMVYQCLLGIPLALTLVALAQRRGEEANWLGRLTTRSGDWSYTLYITHCPLLSMAATAFAWDRMSASLASRLGLLALAFVVTNFLAFVMAKAVERPSYFARHIRRFLSRWRPLILRADDRPPIPAPDPVRDAG